VVFSQLNITSAEFKLTGKMWEWLEASYLTPINQRSGAEAVRDCAAVSESALL